MEIRSEETVIEIVDESVFSPQSADIVRRYSSKVDLTEGGYRPSSRHGVIINGEPIVVFLASGGASCVHDHSALLMDGFLYLAVGDHVVSFDIESKRVRWAVPVDTATCFGVYYKADHDALISHGECEIARFTRDGKVLWASSGADIFTEGFETKDQWVEAIDFNGKHYRFNYDMGNEIAT